MNISLQLINQVVLALLIISIVFTMYTAIRLFFQKRRKQLSHEILTFLEVGTSKDSLVRLLKPKGYSDWEIRSAIKEIDEIIATKRIEKEQAAQQQQSPETSSSQSPNESQH